MKGIVNDGWLHVAGAKKSCFIEKLCQIVNMNTIDSFISVTAQIVFKKMRGWRE